MTWQELLADIRADLQDTSETNPRWSDETLYRYTRAAVRDYSVWFPMRLDKQALVLTDGAYPLPADFIEDIHIECPEGSFLEKRQERPGVQYGAGSSVLYYYISGGKVYLNASTANDVLLTYHACHGLPTSETNLEFVFDIPIVDTELIVLYVMGKAYEQMRSRQSALDRFSLGGGDRTDNPVRVEVADFMAAYHEKIAERISGGVINLYRPGRMS